MLRTTARVQSDTIRIRSAAARALLGSVVLLAALGVLVIVAASLGPLKIPPSHTFSELASMLGVGTSTATGVETAIIQTVRLPRIVLAIMVGAGLGVSGAVMQGLFRNPMADPGIIGISTGASLGAVIAIAIGAAAVTVIVLPVMAFAGAMATLLIVWAIAGAGGRFSMAALLLSGVAMASFLGSMVSAIILFTENQAAQREMLFWLAGGLDSTRWPDVRIVAPVIAAVCLLVFAFARDLNLMLVGEEEAKALGVRVKLVRNTLLVCASLATGVAVAFTGTIAFVGLVVPHVLRLLIGADHRVLLPLSALGGGLFLLAADTLARMLISPAEMRVGIITAFFGAPFFIFLLIKNKSRAGVL